MKEKDIEAKLKQVVNDWSAQNFQFSSFKSRGELLLKGTNEYLYLGLTFVLDKHKVFLYIWAESGKGVF